ncbi:CGNR zinc finger domain-containing protein [Amycolatopsis orientalis]|uniref:CGNR zinc finger domain-containing protein n=1 Tax=Amycolatopsis orientalis TaxID=31958 RepID=UPI0003FB5B85|nr:CGNR zinc finger domain-containing protein [Amycolatopsis orientalis]
MPDGAELDGHHAMRLETGVALINALTGKYAHGRAKPLLGGRELVRAAADAIEGDGRVDLLAAERLRDLASRLREVVEALSRNEDDQAAGLLNRMLADSRARPVLHRHDERPWHLHFHSPDADLVQQWVAGLVVSVAAAFGEHIPHRVGLCAAPRCDQVYVDASQAQIKRYCGLACQNRVKAAAYRARVRRSDP